MDVTYFQNVAVGTTTETGHEPADDDSRTRRYGCRGWLEAATVTFLFALSLLLESWSVGRARKAVQELLNLSPPTARCKECGSEAAKKIRLMKSKLAW